MANDIDVVVEKLGRDFEYQRPDKATLIIPAVHNEVGDLWVQYENGELAVSVGVIFHTHFAGDNRAEETAQFVVDFMAGEIVIAVHYFNGGCVGASCFNLKAEGVTASELPASDVGEYGGRIVTKRFLWSTPVN